MCIFGLCLSSSTRLRHFQGRKYMLLVFLLTSSFYSSLSIILLGRKKFSSTILSSLVGLRIKLTWDRLLFCLATKSCPTLQPHGLQHTRLPCPSLFLRVCSNSHPLSQWFYSIISSSVVPFPSCLQYFPASGSFPVAVHIRWPKYWSFSFSISPSSEYSGLISFRMD